MKVLHNMDYFRFLNCMYIKLQKDNIVQEKLPHLPGCRSAHPQVKILSLKKFLHIFISSHYIYVHIYIIFYFFNIIKKVDLNYDIFVTVMIQLIEPPIVSTL